jgi:enoyl-CoA hydratase/carnithine racemase
MMDGFCGEGFEVERKASAAIFRMSRPEKANALTRPMLLGLGAFARTMGQCDDVRVLIVTGDGTRHFCAGADLDERRGWSENEIRFQLQLYRSELGALDTCPKPVIAAINGIALGGGLEIAMACDLRLASHDAVFGQPECALAILPGAGGTQRLPRLVGVARAKEMILLGRRLSSEEALRWGLIHRVCPPRKSVVEDALEWVLPVIEGAPMAQSAALEAIEAWEMPLEDGLEVEARAYEKVLMSEDRREGLRAFQDKRKPIYRGR